MLAVQIFLGLSVFIVAVFFFVAWRERKQYRELYTNFPMEPAYEGRMETVPVNDRATLCGGCFKQRTPDEIANCPGENCLNFIEFSLTSAIDTFTETSDKS